MRLLVVLITLVFVSAQPALAATCKKANPPPVDLATYYAPAAGKSGEELKAALNGIIKGHKRHSYSCIWDILKEADEDPANHDNVIEIYTRRSVPKSRQDRGENDDDSWNREHIWAKSHGFPREGQHAYTDAHHLRAADRSVNSERSNDDFGNGGIPDDECTACREAGNATWEAPDGVKGDVARMMFYMATRYEGGDDSGTPDLELVDRETGIEPAFGKLCTLYEWNQRDPVSEEERRRNDVVYSWQGNRNPFIDHPEYVASIWGSECGAVTPTVTKEELLERLEKLESEIQELRRLIDSM